MTETKTETAETSRTGKHIVVGIDGSESAWRALSWAGAEAEFRQLPVLVTHASHVTPTGVMSALTESQALREAGEFGRQLLDDAVARLAEDHDHVEVATLMREEHPAALLVEMSEDAELVVVGRSGHAPLSQWLLGSTSHRVAAHAKCPVVVADNDPAPAGPVVVGVSPTDGGHVALRFAAAEAERRHVALHAVRSWSEAALTGASVAMGFVNPYPVLVESEGAILDAAIAYVESDHPDVTVTKELTSVGAYQALPDAGEKASLLVIGRRRADDSPLPKLGSLASWLAHHAPCPLAIVPPPAQ